MKIAVPVFGENIATTFDFVDEIVVFVCINGKAVNKQHFFLNEQLIPLRAAELKDFGINILICGAISNPATIMLQHHGIEVFSGIAGGINIIVDEFLRGNINLPQYRLPGFARRGYGRRHGRHCWVKKR